MLEYDCKKVFFSKEGFVISGEKGHTWSTVKDGHQTKNDLCVTIAEALTVKDKSMPLHLWGMEDLFCW
jgi:hypothetical protein